MQNTILQPNTPGQKNALESLDLTQEMFKEIGQRILLAHSQATANDATMAPGMYAYLAAVRGVRDVLHGNGWKASRQANIELATNAQQKISILVSSGNKYIGREEGDPGNKNPKGRQTQKIIFENFRQLSLFPELEGKEHRDGENASTWFLFYRLDLKRAEMRMELSLPTQFDFYELKVSGWMQRIILDSIEFDSVSIEIEPDFAPEVEFDIRRKAND
ncbi:MAG: hypothetical protein ABFS18_06770 [Thermodesulfobacteriota bacterium]